MLTSAGNTRENVLSNVTALADSLDSIIFDNMPRQFIKMKIFHRTLSLPPGQDSKDRSGLIESGRLEADRGHRQLEVKVDRFVGINGTLSLPLVLHRLGRDTARVVIFGDDHHP